MGYLVIFSLLIVSVFAGSSQRLRHGSANVTASTHEAPRLPARNATARYASASYASPTYGNYGHHQVLEHVTPVHAPPTYNSYGVVSPRQTEVAAGSFDHVYHSDLGSLSSDYYRPANGLRSLPPVLRDVLQRFRYTQECGVTTNKEFLDGFHAQRSLHSLHGLHHVRYSHGSQKAASEHPWQAAVLGWTPEGYALRCSATVLHPYLLVASAQCLEGVVEPDLKIVLGVSDLLDGTPVLPAIERAVERIFVHEKYDSGTLSNNLALMQLKKPVDFKFTPHIVPACLPSKSQTFSPSNCRVVGWKTPVFTGTDPTENLIEVSSLKLVRSSDECSNKLSEELRVSEFAHVPDSKFFTKSMHCVTGKDSCLPAAGASLVCDVPSEGKGGLGEDGLQRPGCTATTYLAGFLDWSNENCGKEGLSVMTELVPYASWIENLLSPAGGLQKFDPSYYAYPSTASSIYPLQKASLQNPYHYGVEDHSGIHRHGPIGYDSPAYGPKSHGY